MAKNIKKKSLTLILRNYFIAGVVVLIPIGFTLYLSKVLINLSSKILPENINPNSYLPYAIPGIEIIISLVFITAVEGLSLSFLGKKILKLIDDLFLKNATRSDDDRSPDQKSSVASPGYPNQL